MNTTKKIVGIALALLAHVALADPLYQSEMTIAGYSGTTELTNFPLLVKISESRISGFKYSQCAAGGADLSFASSDGTTLPYEIDTWNTAGESLVWVKVPNIAGTTTKFHFRWCDTEPPANDPTQVWSEYAGVWHLGDAEGKDSTGHGFTATFPGQTSTNSASKIGSGSYTVGWLNTTGNTKITIPNYDSQNVGSNFTASGWFYFDAESWTQSFFCRKAYFNSGNGWQTNFQTSYTNIFLIGNDSGGQFPHLSSNASYRWLNYTVSFDNRTAIPYDNGTAFSSTLTVNPVKDNGLDLYVGGGLKGTIDEIRIRKAPSSADWVKAEYDQVEVASFVTAGATQTLGAKQIEIDSTTEQYGTVSPAYGIITEPEVGSNYVFTCTQSNQVLIADAKRAVCRGWKLYRLPNNELIKSSADEGESPYECTYTYQLNKGVKIVWEWVVQYKVTATTRRDCTVTDAGGWLDEGTTFSATTAGLDVHTFHQWTDGSGATVESSLSLSKPVTSAQNYYALFTGEYWVATNGVETAIGSKSAPFATLTNAMAHATVDGDKITIKAGTYNLPTAKSMTIDGHDTSYGQASFWMTNAVTVVGEEGPEKTIFDGQGQGSCNAFCVQNAKAVLSGVTVKRVNTSINWQSQTSPTIELIKGFVTNCIVRDCALNYVGGINIRSGAICGCQVLNVSCSDSYSLGAGINLSKASGNPGITNCLVSGCSGRQAPALYASGKSPKVYGCEFRNCTASNTGRGGLAAVYLTGSGGFLENCVITNNKVSAGSIVCAGLQIGNGVTVRNSLIANNRNTDAQGSTGGVYMDGASAVLENCTVVNNYAKSETAHGLYQANGTVRNCIIGYNGPTVGLFSQAGNHVKTTGTVAHTDTYPAMDGDENRSEEPQFVDAQGDYHLSNFSDLFDRGLDQTWMTTAKDLDGKPRISGKAVNLGCYEDETPAVKPFTATGKRDVVTGGKPLAVHFSATLLNTPDPNDVSYLWTFGDGETSTEEAPTHVYTSCKKFTVTLDVTSAGTKAPTYTFATPIEVGPSEVYVNTTGTGTWPYDTEGTGTNDIVEAMASLQAPASGLAKIHCGPGSFSVKSTITIKNIPLEIIGNGTTLMGCFNSGIIILQNKDSILRGLNLTTSAMVYGSSSTKVYGGVLTVSSGTVTNCSFKDTWTAGWCFSPVIQTGGLITDCLFSGCKNDDAGAGGGGRASFLIKGGMLCNSVISKCTAPYCVSGGEIEGGIVSNCTFIGCSSGGTSGKVVHLGNFGQYPTGTGILTHSRIIGCKGTSNAHMLDYYSGTALRNVLIAGCSAENGTALNAQRGTTESCTIVSCTNNNATASGIVAAEGAKVYNTLVWDCRNTSGAMQNIGGAGTFDHCLTDVNPLFNPHPKRAYHPTLGSPAVNAGVKRDWMTADTLDLDGRPRIKGRAPDIGCFEHPATGFMLLVK